MIDGAFLKTAGVAALDLTGVVRLLRPLYGGKGAILLFHRVLPDSRLTLEPGLAVSVSQLRGILRFLDRSGMEVISLSEVPARLRSRDRSSRFIAITMDDGFLDNLEHGLPVFREFRAPFTVFPSTGFIGRQRVPWSLLLEEMCLHSDRVALRPPGREPVEFARSGEETRLAFYQRIRRCAWTDADWENCLPAACEAAGLPVAQVADRLFLSWDQLRAMSKDPLITIGAHTVTHQKLAKMPESQAEWEIQTGREELERQLGSPVPFIAYPFGYPASCGPREFRLAEKLGFSIGLTTRHGNLRSIHQDSLYSLPRHSLSMVPHIRGTRYLRISLDGIWDTPVSGTLAGYLRRAIRDRPWFE